MSYLFAARALRFAGRFEVVAFPPEPVFRAFAFSVSLCLRGGFAAPWPTNAAFTQTTGGKPSTSACQELPSSLEP
jgi:hypothetical protein